uniref:Acetyl-coenzyme A carboxylase carboxyl transferase subunit alpha n=1 Tax=Sciadococcus taiwanensis TaxID=3028030 RepID=A0A9Y1I230_9RHOD|nr:acetyl-CoA carboxylase carboxyltransferase alphasubunit [Sciadococcus taiwanensis]
MNLNTQKNITLEFERPILEIDKQIKELVELASQNNIQINSQLEELYDKVNLIKKQSFEGLTPGERLQLARHPKRPTTLDYIDGITDKWIELHGDRRGFDDPAMVIGIGNIDQQPVMLIGQQKGRDTKENLARNFGMPSPGGYRKALRLMQHANKFNLPILTFIDTPGAWAGIEAEKLGQGEAIAANLRELFSLKVPIICTVIGEGGSGGALGIGVANHVIMLENSVYTVATPEACAAILWKNSNKASVAAEALKITAQDLQILKVIDEILPEPVGGAHNNPGWLIQNLKSCLNKNLARLQKLSKEELKSYRYNKFRKIGSNYED